MSDLVRSKKEYNKGRIYIVLTALLWGLAGVCVKSIPWTPMSLTAIRCGVGIIILGLYNKSFSLKFDKKMLLGAVFACITSLSYMLSIKLTTAATAIVLQYTAPVLVFLYNVVFKRVKPRLVEIIIVLTVFCGCALSFADEIDPSAMLGNMLGLFSGVAFAAQIIVFSDKTVDSGKGMYMSNVISFVICLPFLFTEKLEFSANIALWLFVLCVFQYGLGNICYSKGCRIVNSVETSLLLTIEPIFNPIPVMIVVGEAMGARALIGFFIVLAGVFAYAALPLFERKKNCKN